MRRVLRDWTPIARQKRGTRPFVHSDEWYNVFTLFPLRIKRTSLVNNAAEQTREWLWRRASAKRLGSSNREPEALTHGSVRGTINRLLSNRRIDIYIQHSSSCKTDAQTLRSSTIVAIIKRTSAWIKWSRESQKSEGHYQEIETSGGATKRNRSIDIRINYHKLFMSRFRCAFSQARSPLFLRILWYSYHRLICSFIPIKVVGIRRRDRLASFSYILSRRLFPLPFNWKWNYSTL